MPNGLIDFLARADRSIEKILYLFPQLMLYAQKYRRRHVPTCKNFRDPLATKIRGSTANTSPVPIHQTRMMYTSFMSQGFRFPIQVKPIHILVRGTLQTVKSQDKSQQR